MSKISAIKTYFHTTSSAGKASYLLACRTANNNKPHTTGENRILPPAIDTCTDILGKEATNKLKIILFGDAFSENIKQQLLNRLNSKPIHNFSIQLDEIKLNRLYIEDIFLTEVFTNISCTAVVRAQQPSVQIFVTH